MSRRTTEKINIISPGRMVPEGGCPQRFEEPEWNGQETRRIFVSDMSHAGEYYDVPCRITGRELLAVLGRKTDDVKALYLGWPAGRFFPMNDPETVLEMDCETVYVVDRSECMADILTRLAESYRSCSCGRCVFGREGTYQLHLIFSDIVMKKGRRSDLEQVAELCGMMLTQTACSLGQAAASTFLSGLNYFSPELEAHIEKKCCPSLVCRPFLSYYIDPERCLGCGECVEACEEDAIEGKKKFIHVLDRDMCEKCGSCAEVCPENAIRIVSGSVPRVPSRPVRCGTWKQK